MRMASGDLSMLIDSDIDALARSFFSSAYADNTFTDWTLDQRLEGFLRRQGLDFFVEDGDAYDLLLDRVMVRIGEAARQHTAQP